MADAVFPSGPNKTLRACMVCSIVLTWSAFQQRGCPNCEHFLELIGSADAVQENTSSVYEGLITLVDPTTSWVAKWQRLDSYVPGLYAVKVEGVLPIESKDAAARAGVQYVPRDGTQIDQGAEMED